jgi:endonuclease III
MIETKLDPQALLGRIDELLEARYRSGDLGNVDDPLAETVYILLSKQTQEPVYQRIYRELRHRYPRWTDVLHASDEDLVGLLRGAAKIEAAGQV